MSHVGVSWKPFVLLPSLIGLVGVLLGAGVGVWWVGVGSEVASSWCMPGFHRSRLSEVVRGSSLQVSYSLGKRLKDTKTYVYIYIYVYVAVGDYPASANIR